MRRPKHPLSLIGLGVLIVGAALVWWVLASDFVARDACLDSGGRWGDGGTCEFE